VKRVCKISASRRGARYTFAGSGRHFYPSPINIDIGTVAALRWVDLPLHVEWSPVLDDEEAAVLCQRWTRRVPVIINEDGAVVYDGIGVGRIEGEVYDLPTPPVPYIDAETGELKWSRFVDPSSSVEDVEAELRIRLGDREAAALVRSFCKYSEPYCEFVYSGNGGLAKPVIDINPSYIMRHAKVAYEGFSLLAARYMASCLVDRGDVFYIPEECRYYEWDDPRFPGQGRLLGEEFRIREVEDDYLRLVGRGGDEYVAWDFVYGVLDSGEWVVMGDDGLYLAEHRGERVVVTAPYRGSLIDVRGPPYGNPPIIHEAPTVKRALAWLERLVGRPAREYVIDEWWSHLGKSVDLIFVLKWPLVRKRWNFEIVFWRSGDYLYVFTYEAGGEDGLLVYEFERRWLIPLGVRPCEVWTYVQERPGHVYVKVWREGRELCVTYVDSVGRFYVASGLASLHFAALFTTAEVPPADFPSTPLPVGGGWSRLVHPPEPFLDFPRPLSYNPHCAGYYGQLPGNCTGTRSRYPGRGRLLGEEFRVKEVDGDYLRLVGRGGDEHVAWNFVYGVLDTGEWVVMGEDGLYLAEYRGGRVVVVAPYGGPVERVRGPPYGLLYPVVVRGAVRWPAWAPRIKVDVQLLLRWPLARPRWGFGELRPWGVYGLGRIGRGVPVRVVKEETDRVRLGD